MAHPLHPFIGRKEELDSLKSLLKKNSSSLVVIKGRRRVGKSRLVAEFAKGHTFYKFSGLPPTFETTKQDQLEAPLSLLLYHKIIRK